MRKAGLARQTDRVSDHPSERVVEQRVRNRIIEYLELAASYEDQRDYEAAVPIAHVPYEVINQWEDNLPHGPTAIIEPTVYSAQELDALKQFDRVWRAAADEVPDDYPTLEQVQSMDAWKRLRSEAAKALAVFARRGKLSEEHEQT